MSLVPYKKSKFNVTPFDFSLVTEVDSYVEMGFNVGQLHVIEYEFNDYPDLYLIQYTNQGEEGGIGTFTLIVHGVHTYIDNECGLQVAVRNYITYHKEKNGVLDEDTIRSN